MKRVPIAISNIKRISQQIMKINDSISYVCSFTVLVAVRDQFQVFTPKKSEKKTEIETTKIHTIKIIINRMQIEVKKHDTIIKLFIVLIGYNDV